MKRKMIPVAVAALGAFAAALYLSISGELLSRPAPELSVLVHQGDSGNEVRLYPASEASRSLGQVQEQGQAPEAISDTRGMRSVNRTAADGSGLKMTYILNPDGSTEDITAGREGTISRFVYFPRRPEQDGDGRRLHIMQKYAGAPDKRYVSEEKILREDGSRQEYSQTAPDLSKHVWGYGRDGNTLIHDLVTMIRYSWDPPVVVKEERWREEDHSLSYSDVMDEKDKSHTQTDWDPAHHPLKVVLTPENGFGITIRSFYPGTDKLRLEAKQDSSYTEAKYYRLEGTLHHVIQRSRGMFRVEYMDELGLAYLRQSFYVDTPDHNAEAKHGFIFKLYSVEELGPDGEAIRDFTYWDNRLSRAELRDADFQGRRYYAVSYTMDHDNNVLSKVFLWNTEQGHRADREVDVTPSDGLSPPAPPPSELKPLVNLEEDELPVPPPQYEH